MKKNIFGIILIIVLSVWAIRPLLASGFFPMHDDTQVGRVVAMGRAIRLGQFPVRWVSDLGYGYGYPIFNFYGPLPYYIGGILYALGVPGIIATKAMFVLGIVGAGVVMLWLTKRYLGMSGALLAAVFYVYAPYHAVQIYVRGAVGEFWSLLFLPCIVLGAVGIQRFPHRKTSVLLTGIGIAGTILSHTIMGYVSVVAYLAVLLSGFCISRLKKTIRIYFFDHLLALVVGLGLSSFFWLPAISEMQYTSVADQVSATANYRDHFVCLPQLWNSLWGFGGSAQGCVDGLSFKLGKLHVVLMAVSIVLWIWRKKKLSGLMPSLQATSIALVALSVAFMLTISKPLWDIMPFFAYIQYPWRFLAITVVGMSILIGSIATYFSSRRLRWFVVCASIIAGMFVQSKLFVPQYIYNRPTDAYESTEELRYRVSKISDEYLPKELVAPKNVTDIIRDTIPKTDDLPLKIEANTDTFLRFSVTTKETQSVEVRRAYFPGWQYWVNGVLVRPDVNRGIPTISLPEGYSVVEIRFVNTPVRSLGNILSVLTAAILIYIYGKKGKKTIV